MTTPNEFMIGPYATGLLGLQLFDDVIPNADIPTDPDFSFAEYSATQDTGSGGARGVGFPTATLHWATLSAVQVEGLRGICLGLSTKVLVRLPTNELDGWGETVWHTFSANAIWTSAERGYVSGGRVLEFDLKLRTLIQVE